MKQSLTIVALALLTTACTQQAVTPQDEMAATSSQQPIAAFSIDEIGVTSALNVPQGVQLYHPSKFNQSMEPTIYDTIGSEMQDTILEDFCAKKASQSFIVVDCKIVTTASPHAEFYLSEFNPYNDDYGFIGKYALFKTQSTIYPALLLQLPFGGPEDTGSREAVEQYFLEKSRSPDDAAGAKLFTEFVQSIVVGPVKNAEPDWLLFEDKDKGFSIKYPNGMTPTTFGYDNVFALGSDGQFLIDFYATKEKLETFIDSYWSHRENRRIERSPSKVGIYDGEKVSVIVNLAVYQIFIVQTKSGYFALSYDENYSPKFKDMLPTFRVSE